MCGRKVLSPTPEDPALDSGIVISSERARELYENELRDKYIDCSRLVPEALTGTVENGELHFSCKTKQIRFCSLKSPTDKKACKNTEATRSNIE